MNWVEFFGAMSGLFCLGMVQQQQGQDSWKQRVNVAYSVCLWHQRALLVPFRKQWGAQALGFPCFFAFILMVLWVWVTQDSYMLLYIGFWLIMQLKRRIEAMRLSGQVHSLSEGIPIRLGSNLGFAMLILEPLCMGVLGWILFDVYTDNGLRPTGLPYFFLAGTVTLPFCELVNRTIWNRRLQQMSDARIEGQALVSVRRIAFLTAVVQCLPKGGHHHGPRQTARSAQRTTLATLDPTLE